MTDMISTHAPLAGRDRQQLVKRVEKRISTHAPLAGRDHDVASLVIGVGAFQPTRPLRGATEQSSSSAEPSQFQPTRPLRGATESFCQNPWSEKFQPTRPLRGATSDTGAIGSKTTISTHAPLAGRDSRPGGSLLASIQFQPTRPLRGATTWPHRNYHRQMGFQPTRPLRGATLSI